MAGHLKKTCAPVVWPRQVSLQGSPVSLSWERSLYFRVMVGGGGGGGVGFTTVHNSLCVCKNVESGASPPSVSLLSRADNVLWVQETRCSLLLSDGLAPQGPAQAQSCLCQPNYPASPLLLLQGLHHHSLPVLQTEDTHFISHSHTHTHTCVCAAVELSCTLGTSGSRCSHINTTLTSSNPGSAKADEPGLVFWMQEWFLSAFTACSLPWPAGQHKDRFRNEIPRLSALPVYTLQINLASLMKPV